MGEKAHQSLVKYAGGDVHGEWRSQIDDAAIYQRSLGNAYAASVFIALASTMENSKVDLSGNRIGMFSYGSGSVGEFFSGVISSGYKEFLKSDLHNKILNERTELNYDQYAEFYNYASTFPMNGDELQTPKLNSSGYRFAGVKDHKRIYEVLD